MPGQGIWRRGAFLSFRILTKVAFSGGQLVQLLQNPQTAFLPLRLHGILSDRIISIRGQLKHVQHRVEMEVRQQHARVGSRNQVSLTPTILSVDTSPASTSVQSCSTTPSELQDSTCTPGSSASVDPYPKDESSPSPQLDPSSTLGTALPLLIIPKEEHSPGRTTPSSPIPGYLDPKMMTPQYAEQRAEELAEQYPKLANDYRALTNLYHNDLNHKSVGLSLAADARLNALKAKTQSDPEAEFRTFRKDLESKIPKDERHKWHRLMKSVFDVESGSDVGSDEDDDDE